MEFEPILYAKLTLTALALSFCAEGFVEYIWGLISDQIAKLRQFRWISKIISLGVGIGLSFHYALDFFATLRDEPITAVGQVLTGLIIGRGASFVHQFISKYLPARQ